MTDYNTQIGKQIKQRREQMGLTQSDLAERVGGNRHNISAIESGKRTASLALLSEIAQALNCHLDLILKPNKD